MLTQDMNQSLLIVNKIQTVLLIKQKQEIIKYFLQPEKRNGIFQLF